MFQRDTDPLFNCLENTILKKIIIHYDTEMRLLLLFLLVSVIVNAVLARNLVKRSNCCCDDYRECSSSCSTPCNRPRNCNNNYNRSPCNNNQVKEESDTVPVLIPFPSTSNIPQPSPAEGTIVNNTNIRNDTVSLTIQNTIDNINNISIPITVNSTNENTVVIHFQRVPAENPDDEIVPTVAPSSVDCCLVVTPRACDKNGKNCREGRRQWVCSAVCKGATDIEPDPEPEVPAQLTVRNKNNTSVPTQTTVYSVPIYQSAPQPAPQPTYYFPWRSVQRNSTTRPTQQVFQVPIQPIYTQQRPVYNIPRQPVIQPVYLPQPAIQSVQQPFQIVQQPFQTIQQPIQTIQQPIQTIQQPFQTIQQAPLPRYGLVNQPRYQYTQDNYMVPSYGAPCPYAQQGPSRSPCGSSVVQY
nr:uncharacterized protein LOC111508515 isoform X1 [Leptinotarsa decemlineata]